MKLEIKNRFNGNIIYQNEAESFRALIVAAVKSGANLSGADLSGAKNLSALSGAQTVILPEGPCVGWKKCQNNIIVKLLIPAKARKSNASGRKCRAEFVKVLEVFGAEIGVSTHDGETIYRKGETVTCNKWEEDRWVECGGGIHFFITREEAEAY